LHIVVANEGSGSAENNQLRVELEPERSGVTVNDYTRDGDLLAISRGAYPSTVQLLTTDESDIPSFLSSLSMPQNDRVEQISLSGNFLYILMNKSGSVFVYDISNVYAPELINEISNPQQFEFKGIATTN